ncbi:hypothetical protein [Rubritalea tangerina]
MTSSKTKTKRSSTFIPSHEPRDPSAISRSRPADQWQTARLPR